MQYRRFPRIEDVGYLAQEAERFRQEAELLQRGAREEALLKAPQAEGITADRVVEARPGSRAESKASSLRLAKLQPFGCRQLLGKARPLEQPERRQTMTVRSRRETVTFKRPFLIKGVDRVLPPGSYKVITDEEMIEGLWFAAFRRVATLIEVPAEVGRATQLISVGSVDLSDAQRIDERPK
jgi:hypothetical protein